MKINFEKYIDGLVPAVVQDASTRRVLMVGFMNQEAIEKTTADKKVCFFSRSKNRLWTKGETSGNFLHLKSITADCDNASLLILAEPNGPVCHRGTGTCFGERNAPGFLSVLEEIIAERKNSPKENSYTSSLFQKGINKIAQKLGEEATELIIEAKDDNDDLFLNEAADLFFHYMILLEAKGKRYSDVIAILQKRHGE